MDVAQAAPFIQNMTYEAGALYYEDFPKTEEPVWILGQQYSALYDLDDIKHDVLSKIWCTYRRGFTPIGGTGPMSDQGWGCMLRCGQMMMAQALVNRHLGREWRWYKDKYVPKYYEILKMFSDKKGSHYSIHQIASMGASEGKAVGEWFGPNTIAQVLRKLAVYDEWSNMVLHVAMDNTVIINDIRQLCSPGCEKKRSPDFRSRKTDLSHSSRQNSSLRTRNTSSLTTIPNPLDSGHHSHTEQSKDSSQQAINSEQRGGVLGLEGEGPAEVFGSQVGQGGGAKGKVGQVGSAYANSEGMNGSMESEDLRREEHWRPLVLIIPLRLGLTEINPVYISSLKTCFQFPQSVGIIGGKPNHAHWFIGYVGEELVYLDPHTTQNTVDFLASGESDESYHCQFSSRMPIDQLDPSIALGFYCDTEKEFDDLCSNIQKLLVNKQRTAMFEIHSDRPLHWGPFQPYKPEASANLDFDIVERKYDSDDEFELL